MTRHEKSCIVCGSKFLTRSKAWTREKFCQPKCNSRWWNKQHYDTYVRKVVDRNRVCVVCAKAFLAPVNRPQALTCSQVCNRKRQDVRRKPLRRVKLSGETRSCVRCGAMFEIKKWGGRRQRFCSVDCRSDASHARYVQNTTPAMRLAKKHQNRWRGAWHAAMQRDGWKCRKCGKDSRLLIHHIDGSGEASAVPNHDLENLMTLCYGCHKAAHNLVYRIINGEVYVAGPIFDWLGVGDTVKVLRLS